MNLTYTKESKLYAKALFDFALEAKILDKTTQEVNELGSFFNINSQELNKIFAPIISEEQQLNILSSILTPFNVSDVIKNFLAILIKNHRLNILQNIAYFFNDELLKHKNEKKIDVILAKEISTKEQELIKKELTESFCNKVQVNFIEQEEILGGIILKYDNKMYDASLKNKFNQLNTIIENKIALL